MTGRRWKAIPGKQLAEEIAELHGRFKFDVLRFQDANFGVWEKRTAEFCQTLVDLKVPIHWNGTIEIETIMKYKEETLDLLEASKCHLLWLGAETGTKEMQERIKKHIGIENIPTTGGTVLTATDFNATVLEARDAADGFSARYDLDRIAGLDARQTRAARVVGVEDRRLRLGFRFGSVRRRGRDRRQCGGETGWSRRSRLGRFRRRLGRAIWRC